MSAECEGFGVIIGASYQATVHKDPATQEPEPVELGMPPEVLGLAYALMQRALDPASPGVRVFLPSPDALPTLRQGYVAKHLDLEPFTRDGSVRLVFRSLGAVPVYLVLVACCYVARKFLLCLDPAYDRVKNTRGFLAAFLEPRFEEWGVRVSFGTIELEVLKAINWRIIVVAPAPDDDCAASSHSSARIAESESGDDAFTVYQD